MLEPDPAMLIRSTWENPWLDGLFWAACQVCALGVIAVTGCSLVDDAIAFLALAKGITLTYCAVEFVLLLEG